MLARPAMASRVPLLVLLIAVTCLSQFYRVSNSVIAPELVRDLKARGLWSPEMVENLKYFDGEVQEIASLPADLKEKHLTAGDIDPFCLLRAAARRQKWLDQAQALHLELPRLHADIGAVSALLLTAWRLGLKSLWRVTPARTAKRHGA